MATRLAQSHLRTIPWIAALVVAVALIGWTVSHVMRVSVDVTEAVEGPVVQAFYSTGTISPVREFPIRANVAGTLESVKVDKGDRVKAGDILAAVKDPAQQFSLEKAQAELAEKEARASDSQSPVLIEFDRKIEAMAGMLEIAQREQARQTQAMESRAGSQADLDRSLDRVRMMTMDLESARAQRAAKLLELRREMEVAKSAVNTAKWNLEQQTMRAPIDGVVLDRPTSQGTRVAVNDTVMRVADVQPANLVMRAQVDEEDVAKANIGQVVRLTLYAFPAEVFTGKVQKIYDQADANRRTFEVDVQLDHPNERFQPGMTGELAFIMAEREKATVVPSQAIQNGVVWIVNDSGSLQRKEVTIGLQSIERTEITAGIKSGEKVVISPIGTSKEGETVSTKFVDPSVVMGAKQERKPNGQTLKGIK